MPGASRIPATSHRRSSRVLACRRGSTASATAIIDACRSLTWNAFSCGSRACPRCRQTRSARYTAAIPSQPRRGSTAPTLE
ncbi:transposase zinc-binding domain-containing protein [Pseudomonas sp. Z18(2022)]|uniref:transposase zinc-binding domain-containing protein n=1 Tax=Pseudomonas sp. Z18(2022) TaxID=2983410 RepID=UPI003FA6CF2F